jgi:hypothetical protein
MIEVRTSGARPLAVAAIVVLSLLAGFALDMAVVYVLLLPVLLPLLAIGTFAGIASFWLAGRIRIPSNWLVLGVLAGFFATWLLVALWWILVQGGGQ